MKVVQILKKYDSGDLDILIECKSNFKIHHFQNKNEHKLFPVGSVSKIKKNTLKRLLQELLEEHLHLLLDLQLTQLVG